MFKTRLSISLRITLVILVSFFLILTAISLSVIYSIHLYLMKDAEHQLEITLELITTGNEDLPADIQELISELSVDQNLEISFFLPNGQLLHTVNQQFRIPLLDQEGFTELRNPEPGHPAGAPEVPENREYHVLVLRSPILDIPFPVIVQISQNLVSADYFLSVLKRFLLFADLLGLVISFLIGFSISKRILKPVDEITGRAQRISAQDLSRRIPEYGKNDEITRLSRAFNGMLDRLERSFVKQKRFVSDASHELRTPLAVISGYIKMLDRWAKTSPELLEESIDAIKSETERMQTLIERLLFLARSDSDTLKLKGEPVDLNRVVERAVQDIRCLAPDREIVTRMKPDCRITGDRDMMKQMLLIFLDNGIRYSGEDKPIHVGLSGEEGEILISIRDFGKGIDPDKVNIIFDRFTRLDDSRNQNAGGAGLGLAIAREIIELHGGRVEIRSVPGEGTEFRIFFPEPDTRST